MSYSSLEQQERHCLHSHSPKDIIHHLEPAARNPFLNSHVFTMIPVLAVASLIADNNGPPPTQNTTPASQTPSQAPAQTPSQTPPQPSTTAPPEGPPSSSS